MNKGLENDKVSICGEICSEFIFNHEIYGEKFYKTIVKIDRLSDKSDFIPVMLSERSIDVAVNHIGEKVHIEGQFRSFNRFEGSVNKLELYVFAKEIVFINAACVVAHNNYISLNGVICREPTCRVTPSGREIADVMLAVNRPYGKSDYIPCICWGRNAVFADGLEVGTRCRLTGRIQSREYIKRLPDETEELRTAYEVSASSIELVEE